MLRREDGSQPKVLNPLQTFSYWSVAVPQTTSSHIYPRQPRTIPISVIPTGSSPKALIQLLCLLFYKHSLKIIEDWEKAKIDGKHQLDLMLILTLPVIRRLRAS